MGWERGRPGEPCIRAGLGPCEGCLSWDADWGPGTWNLCVRITALSLCTLVGGRSQGQARRRRSWALHPQRGGLGPCCPFWASVYLTDLGPTLPAWMLLLIFMSTQSAGICQCSCLLGPAIPRDIEMRCSVPWPSRQATGRGRGRRVKVALKVRPTLEPDYPILSSLPSPSGVNLGHLLTVSGPQDLQGCY